MNRAQFASASGADEKWVENSIRLLGLNLQKTPAEARWLGLVRMLCQELGVPLASAARLATEALEHAPHLRSVRLGRNTASSAAIVVDLARYHSIHASALSSALNFGGSKKRGRKPGRKTSGRQSGKQRDEVILSRASDYGVDLSMLQEGLHDSPAERLHRLDQNAAFVAEMRSSMRRRPARPSRPRKKKGAT